MTNHLNKGFNMKRYIKPTVFFDSIEIDDLLKFSQVNIKSGSGNYGTSNSSTTSLSTTDQEITTEGQYYGDAKVNNNFWGFTDDEEFD